MRYLFICLCLFYSQFTYTQDVDIPDGAFLFALLYHGYDLNGDNLIQKNEAEAATSISFSYKGIQSLEGISAFVNLTNLSVSPDRIQGSVDLSALKKLKTLNLSENDITNINLSGLEELTSLDLDDNDIQSIDLEGLNNLDELRIAENKFTQITISELPRLSYLDVDDNKELGTLTLSDLPALEEIDSRNSSTSNLALINLPSLELADFSNNDNLISCEFSDFPNLTRIDIDWSNQLTSLFISNLPSLTRLNCNNASLETLNITNCPKIKYLDARTNALSQIDVSSLLDLEDLNLSSNSLSKIEISSLSELSNADLSNNKLKNLNASNIFQLRELNVENNLLESILLENLPFITDLNLDENLLSSVDLSTLPGLKFLKLNNNKLTSIDLSKLPIVESISISNNLLSTLEVRDLLALRSLVVTGNLLGSASIYNCPELRTLSLSTNQLTSFEFGDLPELNTLNLSMNQLTSFQFADLPELNTLTISSNSLTSLNVNSLLDLRTLVADDNPLTSFSIEGIPFLREISIQRNKLVDLNIADLSFLSELEIGENELVDFSLNSIPRLESLNCSRNHLENLELWDLPNLETLTCTHNNLEQLNVSNLSALVTLDCTNNSLIEMDFSTRPIRFVDISNNALEFINFRNLLPEGNQMQFANNPDLEIICIDEEDFGDIVGKIIIYEMDTEVVRNCELQSSNFFEVSGKTTFDFETDGCSQDDPGYGNMKFLVQNIDGESCYISTANGFHSILVEGPIHTITPLIDKDKFAIDPEVATVNFDHITTRTTKVDFCVTPKIVFNDLDISVTSLNQVRPGFEAEYKIAYSNIGVASSSGFITLNYEENFATLNSTSETVDSNSGGQIIWSFEDLDPGEKRFIDVNLLMNRPQDDPPLVGDEVLKINATITHNAEDFDLSNNEFGLCQTVVNSYDPNDKQCNEGEVIKLDQLDGYLHYLIRFENTGTASAINVVIRDTIDQQKLDVSTLDIEESSHSMTTLIEDDNVVNFNFREIRLPFDDDNNDGYILFKIKPISTLVPFDVIKNTASIYFDFNDPIITNTVETVILRDDDNDGYFEDIDCDDSSANINPGQLEEPYNGIDDDCDPLTLDDDLDADGYVLEEDCDDTSANINPGQLEEPYNGIDDDCDPLTLDDDLDADGYVLEEDCDDTNDLINPDAEEIANNGIDEDCDGEDLTTSSISTHMEGNLKLFPNPAEDRLWFEQVADFQSIQILNANGKYLSTIENIQSVSSIDISNLNNGIYFILIKTEKANIVEKFVVLR